MTTEGLNTVLEAGREGLDAYYKQRTDSFRRDEIRYLTRSLAGESVEYRDIVSSLTKEYGDSEAKQLFRRFLEKGVLAKCETGYTIPIPSMHNWLIRKFSCE